MTQTAQAHQQVVEKQVSATLAQQILRYISESFLTLIRILNTQESLKGRLTTFKHVSAVNISCQQL